MTAPAFGRKAAIAIGAIFLILALFSALNQPGGALEETTGVVQSYGFMPTDSGPPPQIATVRLNDGTVVQAGVPSGVLVQTGQVARLRVSHRVISGSPHYLLVSMEPAK